MINISEAIRKMLDFRKVSQGILAEKMGYSSQSVIATILSRNDMKMSTFVKIANSLDFEVIIQPKGKAGKKPDGAVVVEDDKK